MLAKSEGSPSSASPSAPVPVTFYLYREDGSLNPRRTTIITPYNERIFDKEKGRHEYDALNLKSIVFERGSFETSDPDEIAFLEIYNKGGRLPNGKTWKPATINYVRKELVVNDDERNEAQRVVTRTVERMVIPRSIASLMSVPQLRDLCAEWKVSVPEAGTKEDLMKSLSESGHLQ